CLHTKSSFTF
nr:immunoglobulin light chain junction region [Macaca mulatta]